MAPVAQELLSARALLIQGVSTLLQDCPVMACKFRPEVYIGEKGHLIKTCHGYKRHAKNRVCKWRSGSLKDILVPVETFHLQKMSQTVIKHHQRFDFDRVPAIVKLCSQAGAVLNDQNANTSNWKLENVYGDIDGADSLLPHELRLIADGMLTVWETLRSGVQKLLLVYPAKVCKYCSEVNVGPSGHKAGLCGVFKFESWHETHFWIKADVDDLVPPKIVWLRRPQDPPVLLDEGRNFYGHAPAVVDLCTKAGAVVPRKYFCMNKFEGLSAPT